MEFLKQHIFNTKLKIVIFIIFLFGFISFLVDYNMTINKQFPIIAVRFGFYKCSFPCYTYLGPGYYIDIRPTEDENGNAILDENHNPIELEYRINMWFR